MRLLNYKTIDKKANSLLSQKVAEKYEIMGWGEFFETASCYFIHQVFGEIDLKNITISRIENLKKMGIPCFKEFQNVKATNIVNSDSPVIS